MTVETLKQFTKELAKKITFNTENLYLHVITLRGATANDKFIIQIFDNNAFDLTLSQVEKFIKDKWSFATSASASGNMYGYPVVGHTAGVNTVSEIGVAVGIYYANDTNRFEVIRLKDGAYASAVALTSLSLTQQKTITLALNNVNKGSFQEFTTNLSYNGTKIADIKWTLAKYPTGNGKFHYKWFASGSGNVSVAWTTWSSSVSWSYVTKLVTANFPTDYGSLIQDNIVYDFDIVGVSASMCKRTSSSNADCYFERPNTYETGTRTIKFKAQADYIANS